MATTASEAEGSIVELDRSELQARMQQGAPFKLVMSGSEFAFRAKHLPGSLHFPNPDAMFAALDPDEEIVVYCSNADCHASLNTIQKLLERGYRNVRHYRGGLIDWEAAGLPLEGDWS